MQRYSVQGMTQGEYRRTLAKHKRKADKVINNPSLIKPFVPYKSPDVRKTIVTREEFFKFVVPHVRLLGYWPDGFGGGIDKDVAEFLWNTIQNLQGWKAQQSLFDTWGYLNIDCFYTIRAIEQAMSSYRRFKTAKNNGYDTVHVMTDNHHCGRTTPDNINIKDMEAAYSSQNENALLVPFPSCPLNGHDGGGLCGCAITLGFIARDGDNPKFEKWWRQEIK